MTRSTVLMMLGLLFVKIILTAVTFFAAWKMRTADRGEQYWLVALAVGAFLLLIFLIRFVHVQ
jgi:hypothetical protein